MAQVEIWFQDEARIGQRGTVTRVWALKGTRPRVTRQQQFEYAYIFGIRLAFSNCSRIFGAACPARDLAVGLVMPVVNSEAMKTHLQHIAAQVQEGKHAVSRVFFPLKYLIMPMWFTSFFGNERVFLTNLEHLCLSVQLSLSM